MAKKGILIGVVGLVLLGGGGFVGAAYMGIVKVPGITPKSKLKNALSMYKTDPKKDVPAPVVKKTPPKPKIETVPPKPPKEEPKVDELAGAQHVADVWSQMEIEKLGPILATWKDSDAARVLVLMDASQTAQLLATMDAKRASALSRAIQNEASKVQEPAG